MITSSIGYSGQIINSFANTIEKHSKHYGVLALKENHNDQIRFYLRKVVKDSPHIKGK